MIKRCECGTIFSGHEIVESCHKCRKIDHTTCDRCGVIRSGVGVCPECRGIDEVDLKILMKEAHNKKALEMYMISDMRGMCHHCGHITKKHSDSVPYMYRLKKCWCKCDLTIEANRARVHTRESMRQSFAIIPHIAKKFALYRLKKTILKYRCCLHSKRNASIILKYMDCGMYNICFMDPEKFKICHKSATKYFKRVLNFTSQYVRATQHDYQSN